MQTNQSTNKQQLILDIEKLLNTYGNSTSINPDLLSYMDEKDLIAIIDTLLLQKENLVKDNIEWLEQFKKQYNN